MQFCAVHVRLSVEISQFMELHWKDLMSSFHAAQECFYLTLLGEKLSPPDNMLFQYDLCLAQEALVA